MNTVKSFWVGWGALCVAGGGAYYFAKKSINADKLARFEAEQKRKRLQASYMNSSTKSSPQTNNHAQQDTSENTPGTQSSEFGNKDIEKSKYEPVRPFKSMKGDRFS
ncbi:hypothetical protein GcM1_230039 [Golovinomyces cichoracearum]|uniref:Uncharacterized protein n=1 Tax=Golovinomyces cichoracearum TaxID=62708 RepID=A0A420IN40_9PEZI|nr:hypothetical protein GcM1_230039 [Golovinomyces cichoracearum]